MSFLEQIQSSADLKGLSLAELEVLAQEIREKIITVTSQNGGHLGPNLGVVELTIALHRVFQTPKDRFVFDVSHQGYVHKLLTGRNDARFNDIRLTGGLSGFLNREESEHDSYGAGHAGTALSAAVGMACARDRMGGDEHVVAVCGDAAFTCGITFEALNNIPNATRRLIVILNDNEWSIDKNVGAISTHLNRLITNPIYNRINDAGSQFLSHIPGGDSIRRLGRKAMRETKDMFLESSVFETFGLRYLGPIDGHDIKRVSEYLEFAKKQDVPVLLHVITQKGKGCGVALDEPEKFHGTSPFDVKTGSSTGRKVPGMTSYQDVFGRALVRHARKDSRIIGITGAMPSGTGLSYLRDELKDQYFDVGIAEEHAVLFAAGAATRGLKPVCAIYSTFLQRSYDPIIHDVCLQNLNVLFCMDRAGLSPNDGATHHGLFDIAYLRCVPNTILMQPRNEDELCDMLATGIAHEGPCFIRYPRGSGTGATIKAEPKLLPIGKAELLSKGREISLWALGDMVEVARGIAKRLEQHYEIRVSVVNARFAKPIDSSLLLTEAQNANLIVTLEDGVVNGGFGSAVMELLSDHHVCTPVCRIGWPDRFVEHASSVDELRKQHGLSAEQIYETICRHPALAELPRLRLPAATPS
ncbi:MAG: 1-deoxy-D-xylulose-5-phosphate synthase [Puniceicoccaceae bacterium]